MSERQTMRKQILRDGFVVVRDVLDRTQLAAFRKEAIDPAIAAWKSYAITDTLAAEVSKPYGVPWGIDMYKLTAENGYITDRMLRFATGRSYYDLIPPKLWYGLRAFGNLSRSVVAHCRQVHPTMVNVQEGGSWSKPVAFHYDYWYHRENVCTLNVWTPFDPVGRDAPTLRLVKASVDVVRRAYAGPAEPTGVERRFTEFAVLALDPGDVAIFTNWTLHQTHILPSMTKGRLSAEIRLCAEDHAFHRKSFWKRLILR